MKVVILAGGKGTRLSEETDHRPKPMIEVGGRPLLHHILSHFASHGLEQFVIALGYRGDLIKRYFLDYRQLRGDLRVCTRSGEVQLRNGKPEDWVIDLVDTGLETATGGRLKRLAPLLTDGTFMMTYGDGVSDVNVRALIQYHRGHGRLATITAVRPPARFGRLELDGGRVREFSEKPQIDQGWINGGYFVLEPAVLDYIDGDETPWESQPLERLARDGQLMAYQHGGFWQCMDTLRDLRLLESLHASGRAPWIGD